MLRIPDAAGNEVRLDSTVNPQADPYCRKLREEELISTFCKARFSSTPPTDRTGWEQEVQAAFECLNFASSAASEHQDELRACVLQVESAVREANLETKRILGGTELSTMDIVLDIMDQLENVITKRCPAAFACGLRESIDTIMRGCRASTNASSYGSDEAWHSYAHWGTQTYGQVSGHEGVEGRMAEVLSETEKVLDTRCFPDDEQKVLPQIIRMALDFRPLYPGVADSAELRRGSSKKGLLNQEVPRIANKVFHESYGDQQVLSQHKTSRQPKTNHSFGVAAESGSSSFGTQFWTHPSYPLEAISEQNQHPAVFPPLLSDAGQSVPAENSSAGDDDARYQTLRLAEEDVACLVNAIEEGIMRLEGRRRRPRQLLDVKEQLHALLASLSLLNNKPPPLNTRAWAILGRMRSSLIDARKVIKSLQDIRMSNRYMARFNNAIVIISRLRQQARLAGLEGVDALEPQELESLREVTNSPDKSSPMKCVASAAYAALLKTDSETEVERVLDSFLAFFDSTSEPIDRTTAQLYLLILLHIRYDDVKRVKPETQNLLDKLIVLLRVRVFKTGNSEISICDFPEFKDFYLAHFGASTWQGFDWRDSLRADQVLANGGQRPLITKLVRYGSSFCEGLDRLTRLTHHDGPYGMQARLLGAFRSCLLRIHPPECVFADDQTFAYLEQFAAFAEMCLNQCRVDGSATGHPQLQILEVTLDCLQWCRLLCSYLGVTPPNLLKEAYDTTANARILTLLWKSRPTASMPNAERAFISRGILAALNSNKLDDELLACTKMFLDRNVPPLFVAGIFDELLIDRSKQNSDHDKMVTLLASECRIQLLKPNLASRSGIVGMPTSIMEDFVRVLVQAQMVAKGVQTLPTPTLTLNASLRKRFVASNAHETARQLSVDVVLEEALQKRDSDHLTVSEVAHHVATYLLGDSFDEEWLNFLIGRVQWCRSSPQQLAASPDKLMTLAKSVDAWCKAFRYESSRIEPLNSIAQATPDLIRHFVHMATLKWLLGKMMGMSHCPDDARQVLIRMMGEHVFGWMPLWLTLMNGRRVLFPSGVIARASFVEGLCFDVARLRKLNHSSTIKSNVLDHDDVSAYLRRLLRAIGSGTLTFQDLEVLLKQHVCPVLSRPNRNMFLTFLLWAWHHECLPVDIAVIEGCIKDVFHEGSQPANKGRLSVNTMQSCIQKLLNQSIPVMNHLELLSFDGLRIRVPQHNMT
eukprot:Blabericola_migrator_1__2429@NODE_1684_length_4009_cov_40_832319_g1078_i1_p1_GENE_NODE_1684_length_4009_cov_40_832319_g1078_i1NODE_1684_length_4009_cov_40_832319_g1078_i1_p1_ORF_typecomplete_len1238_score184_67EH_Signature/PF15611_6/7_8e02EH_Signature/PF15611_6/0_22_NODE_1684_length_4009_cov_40_832319_g1078_i1743715